MNHHGIETDTFNNQKVKLQQLDIFPFYLLQKMLLQERQIQFSLTSLQSPHSVSVLEQNTIWDFFFLNITSETRSIKERLDNGIF